MIHREKGFSLIELMITMVIFVIVIASASSVFTGLLTQFKQQSKIAETNIEGAVGLGILQYDLESAGYGLPWNGLTAYNEGAPFNNSPNAPKGIESNNNTEFNNSDYLVIRGANVANNIACKKWTNIRMGNVLHVWNPASEALANGNTVIVIEPGLAGAGMKTLVQSGGNFFAVVNNPATGLTVPGFAPTSSTDAFLVYGIDDNTPLRRPFNRADYYIQRPADIPARCAPNTGVLYKATMNHANDVLTLWPILDCVADMQVIFRLDTNSDGIIDPPSTDNISALTTAAAVRTQVKEVRVYVLAHEGQFDPNYTHPNPNPLVGEAGIGQIFNIAGTNLNYRWKLYTIFVKTDNLN